MEPPLERKPVSTYAAPAFLADRTVGRLARWLRLVGYDTVYAAENNQLALLELAAAEDRVVLTRDTLLYERRAVQRGVVKAVFVRYDHYLDQLRQVREELGLQRRSPARCMVCNTELQEVSADEACARVPPYVAATQSRFTYCPVCDRVNWAATHWDDMECRLAQAGL